MKIYKPIIIIAGEPNSVFLEIYFKTINLRKTKCPIILIASKELVLMQMKRKGSFQFHLEVKISFFYFFKEQKFESQPYLWFISIFVF